MRFAAPVAAGCLLLAAARFAVAQGGEVPAVVTRLCAPCHQGADAERGFDVTTVFTRGADQRERADAAWARVRSHTMPPPDAEIPATAAERQALALVFAACMPAAPGARVATARRLSRRQFERSVQELTGLAWSAGDRLPEDVSAYGFDTIGDVAGITPAAFEAYVVVAADLAARVLADAPATARVFGASGQSLAAALPAFLERAFRRPPVAAELEARERLFARCLADGGDERAARSAVLQSVFASPAFLLRTEVGEADDRRRLSPWELAARLSFAFASTTPDAALLALARSGELRRPEVREARRLALASDGRTLAEDFFAQWLRLRDVLTANADFRRYPEIWNHALRPAFHEEALRFTAALVAEDCSVLALLDADFTFANELLAKVYGLPPVAGGELRRVALPDRRRGGVLGMGAMLMTASYPLRTSPVLRGRWILDQLLAAGTPPPPPDVAKLPADDVPAAGLSLRAQLEQHRRDRRCAACHAQIDPLGFALENYDVLGRWRTQLHEQPVDARGTLPDGTVIDGPIALKDALLARKQDFVRAMASRLLTFAIGRPLLPADEPELVRIVAAVEAGEYKMSAMIAAVVTSPLFVLRDPGAP